MVWKEHFPHLPLFLVLTTSQYKIKKDYFYSHQLDDPYFSYPILLAKRIKIKQKSSSENLKNIVPSF